MSKATTRCEYFVTNRNGDTSPCIVARYPDGRIVVVALMTDTEQNHEHAENICDQRNSRN